MNEYSNGSFNQKDLEDLVANMNPHMYTSTKPSHSIGISNSGVPGGIHPSPVNPLAYPTAIMDD